MMEALPAVVPATSARPRRQVWSVGGGKGGIGKSLITAALGYQLARIGRKVVLVDADLGGANLHTCLGLAGPSLTPRRRCGAPWRKAAPSVSCPRTLSRRSTT